MTIRARLTVWYAGVLLTSLFFMAGIIYYEFVVEPRQTAAAGSDPQPIGEEIAEVVIFYAVPTGILTIIGGWWLLRKALAPLDQLAAAAEQLQVHNLYQPLPRTGNGDEVDRLSKVLNETNGRLAGAFQRVQEFTLHASHELKTPLTVLHLEIEAALSAPETTLNQREMLASQLDEIQRLTHIVSGLSLLAKADSNQLRLERESLRLDELVRDSFTDAIILAHSVRIQVTMPRCEEITLCGDRHRLRQLLLTLTDNAIKYNQPDGWIKLTLERNGNYAQLSIANSGKGIPPTMLGRVFDRFYRGEESHNKDIEGCGLGLSIAQWIAKAHGGDIKIASTPNQATSVTVQLPTSDLLPPAPHTRRTD